MIGDPRWAINTGLEPGSKADWFRGKSWQVEKRKREAPPRRAYRRPKEYLLLNLGWSFFAQDNVTIEKLSQKFESFGGEVFKEEFFDTRSVVCVFIDDYIPDDKLYEALDLFDGHETTTVDAEKVRLWQGRQSTLY